jgi:FkbM family methyltransferase
MVSYKTLFKYLSTRPHRWIPAIDFFVALILKRNRISLFSDSIFLECGLSQGQGAWCALTGLDYEPELNQFLSKLNPSDVVFDIGANIGTYAIRSAIKLEPVGFVYAFEPLDENRLMLQNSCIRNEVRNISVIEKAVGDKVGSTMFSTAGRNSSARVVFNSEPGSHYVEMITLDSFIEQNNVSRLDWIKMDIEGAEPLVLKGMEKSLKKFKPSFLFENHEGGKETCEILSKANYRIGVYRGNCFYETQEGENLFAIPKND